MSAGNLTSKAYRHLHQQLVSGRLLPGAVISEKQLAVELGFSRTPVGEAVRQLVAEGFVEQVPRFGTVVKEITKQDIDEIYELREAIEPYAASKAASHISSTQLKQLEVLYRATGDLADWLIGGNAEVLDGTKLEQFLAADMAFHMLILRAAENSRIIKVVQDSRLVSQVFHMRRMRHDSVVTQGAYDFHGKILAALRAGDGSEAADWMFKHIRVSREATLAFLSGDRPASPVVSFASLGLPEEVLKQIEDIEQSEK